MYVYRPHLRFRYFLFESQNKYIGIFVFNSYVLKWTLTLTHSLMIFILYLFVFILITPRKKLLMHISWNKASYICVLVFFMWLANFGDVILRYLFIKMELQGKSVSIGIWYGDIILKYAICFCLNVFVFVSKCVKEMILRRNEIT